eukprot:Platyproteum_vivax@DN5916_c0_g1_i3.p1
MMDLNQIHTICLAGFGAFLIGYGCYTSYTFAKYTKPNPRPPSENGRRRTFDKKAAKYDWNVCLGEMVMGTYWFRRKLVAKAEGKVLEVAAGTCRNLKYYRADKVKSLIVTDFSRDMLLQCSKKKRAIKPINFTMQLANSMFMDYEDETFDTVVDTFGICSFEKPVETLREMRRVTKKNGRILLLEHGKSATSDWMNRRIKKKAIARAQEQGCWFNKNIVAIAKEAGLEILEDKRTHFGTTYMIVAQPKDAVDTEGEDKAEGEVSPLQPQT